MDKIIHSFLKVIAVFLIFCLIFLGNLGYKTLNIHSSKSFKNDLDPVSLEYCEQRAHSYVMYLGCIEEDYGVGSYAMYLSIFLFILFSLLIFKPGKKYLLLTPLFIILWIILSELTVKIFNIPIIHSVPMEGDIQILDGLYSKFINNGIELLYIFTVVLGISAGACAYEIKKYLLKRKTLSKEKQP